jgi:hypothetical protein
MNVKYILGTITIIVIVGGAIYAIKKSKDLQKTEGEAISLDEAKDIVAKGLEEGLGDNVGLGARFDGETLTSVSVIRARKVDQIDIDALLEEEDDDGTITSWRQNIDIDEVIDDSREIAGYNASFISPNEELDDEEEEPTVLEDEDDILLAETITEEDKKLRYEPNSRDARNQFIRMELAEWRPSEETYKIMLKLFDFPFQPQNDGDDFLRTNIIDYRVQFFGFGSKWAREVSFADVMLYYARLSHYNCDESVKYWLEYFLEFNEFDYYTSSLTIDELLNQLNSHTYFNEERQTFGLFGLTRDSMDQAIRIANGNIDRSVTYEIEFNEFLKSFL